MLLFNYDSGPKGLHHRLPAQVMRHAINPCKHMELQLRDRTAFLMLWSKLASSRANAESEKSNGREMDLGSLRNDRLYLLASKN